MSGFTTALAVIGAGGNFLSNGGPLSLSLGSVVFSNFEIPEQLSSLGGLQLIAEHKFPGGRITQQTFGPFPSHVEWRGLLTGSSALARMREIDRLRVVGQPVTLSYGSVTLLGLVSEFVPSPKHQWLVPYTIKFQPSRDLSAQMPWDQILSLFSIVNDALTRLSTLLGIIIPGGSGTLLKSVAFQQVYAPLPPTMAAPLTDFVNLTFDALQAALGLPQNISPGDGAAIVAAAQQVQIIATPLSQSADSTVSSPAIDALGYVNTIVTAVSSPTLANVTMVHATNPNLYTLAAQYYGDATKWRDIAVASGISPPDPLPTGQFTLTIPALVS